MTKTAHYRHGKTGYTAYIKAVGKGWEVGFMTAGHPVFVGNFIHSKEATQWYALMNRQIRQFSKRYSVGPTLPVTWYSHFMRNHLYTTYYKFLDRLFTRYNSVYQRAFQKDERKYRVMRKRWSGKGTRPFLKVA